MSQAMILGVAGGVWSNLSKLVVVRRAFWLAIAAVLSAGCVLFAQVTTTSMTGTVTDQTGATVAGAQVTAISTDTGLSRSTNTNGQGEYRIEFLPAGRYSLQVSGKGFKKYIESGIVLEVNVPARVDAKLQLGDIDEAITVSGESAAVNTVDAEIGRTVENTEVVNLPLVNRNVYTLLTLTPGVQSSTFADNAVGLQQQVTMINGGVDGGAGSVAYYLDGGLNMTGVRNTGNALPNPDAVQEFRVETNNYSAEYGRSNGGVVNVITKSGTNDFHGSVFEFVRNTILNANTWNNAAATPAYHRNQFGGTIGGPIRKNKIFFFGSYDGLRQITPNFLSGVLVPTTNERSGNFSADTTITLKDPLPGGPTFTGNMIPSTVMDPTAMYILNKYVPSPNQVNPATGIQDEFQGFANPSPYNYDEFLGKVDVLLTSKQQFTASYFENQGTNSVVSGQAATSLPWSTEQYSWRQQNLNLGHTWEISANKTNQMWLSYTRNFGGRTNLPAESLCSLSLNALALPSTTSCASQNLFTIQGTPDLPNLSVSGYFSLNDGIAGPATGTNLLNFREVFSYTHGRHSFLFGGELSHDNDKQQTLLDNWGSFTFAGKFSGNNLADFELGLQSSQEQDAPVTPYTNSFYTALFVQDNFRMFPRLTLNMGLRWDVQTPPTGPGNLASTFIEGVQSVVNSAAPTGELFVGDPGVSKGVIPVRWHHVAPRLGVAWDPTGKGKTSISAGAGVFYGNVSGNEWNTTSNFEPFAIRLTSWPNLFAKGKTSFATLTNPYTAYPGGDPFPYSGKFVAGGSIFGVAPNFQWPYSYQYNLSVQHQFGQQFTLKVAYVGTFSHDLPFATDLNYPTILCGVPAVAGCGTTFLNDRRPIDNANPGIVAGSSSSAFGQVFQVKSNQTANYDALQVSWVERLGRRFTLNGFYTFSKNLQSVELQNNTTNPTGAGQIPQDYLNLAEDRGRTDDDIRHMFVTSLVWQLQYYHGANRAWKALLNDWSVSPIVTVHSGLPFTVTTGADVNQDGQSGNDRPNIVPGVSFATAHGTRAQQVAAWFNTAAFAKNAITASDPTGDGNAPRNFLTGPGYRDVDLAIFRDIRMGERFTLQARGEATNTFNFVNLNNPVTTMSAANFGTITGAGTMRQIQIGLRLTF
jgi:hypothetical protein